MKLKEWADKQGISYLTAWRWFKAGDPRLAKAYQSDSGTIIVPDENESSEQVMAGNTQNDAMSLFLKKTVEFSKNNSSVEDFAAYVISNFSLKLNSTVDGPKYSKQKPKPEEIQRHFKQFLPNEEKQEHLKAVKTLIKEQNSTKEFLNEELSEIPISEPEAQFARVADPQNTFGSDDDLKALLSATAPQSSGVHLYGAGFATEGLVNRSVDLNTTPQQINYTGSTNQAFGSSFSTNAVISSADYGGGLMAASFNIPDGPVGTFLADVGPASSFQPTKKELQSIKPAVAVAEVSDQASDSRSEELPRKRGRKPTKKR